MLFSIIFCFYPPPFEERGGYCIRVSVRPSVRPSRFLSGVILQNYKTQFHETWWKGSTVIGDMHIISPSIFGDFSWSYGPL